MSNDERGKGENWSLSCIDVTGRGIILPKRSHYFFPIARTHSNEYTFVLLQFAHIYICMWATSASFTCSYYRDLKFLAQCQILINQNINMKQISLAQCGQMHTLFCLYANLPICIKWRLHVCNNQRCSIFYEDHCRIYL